MEDKPEFILLFEYPWGLCKLSPNEYYKFITTGEYPLKGISAPPIPTSFKDPSLIGSEDKQ